MVRKLIIINVVMLLLNELLRLTSGINLNGMLGLYFPKSEFFRSWQIVTHMFMHGGFIHLFFNMFALWMFGRILEQVWGPKRFLLYYLVTGLGAAFFFGSASGSGSASAFASASGSTAAAASGSGSVAASASASAADSASG